MKIVIAAALALALTGCAEPGRGAEVVPLQTTTAYPQPTVTTGSQSFFTQYQEWLRNGTGGAPSAPSGVLELLLPGAGQ